VAPVVLKRKHMPPTYGRRGPESSRVQLLWWLYWVAERLLCVAEFLYDGDDQTPIEDSDEDDEL
jgi:hypothetical protein